MKKEKHEKGKAEKEKLMGELKGIGARG